jgi:hypothetical protein
VASSAGWIDAYYPNRGGVTDVGAVVPAFFDFLTGHVETVREHMRAGVQTNDVTRAAPLSAAMNHVALATGLPLRLLEVGSSAGLNLLLDKYFVESTTRSWGPDDSPLRLTGQFESGDPEVADLRVAERRGCDLNPLDVHDEGSADLLRSFVWPEHVERASRLDAALRVARSSPRVTIDASPATPWVAEHAANLPDGLATVIYHSIVLPYFDSGERDRFAAAVRAAGERARESGPAGVDLDGAARRRPQRGRAGVPHLAGRPVHAAGADDAAWHPRALGPRRLSVLVASAGTLSSRPRPDTALQCPAPQRRQARRVLSQGTSGSQAVDLELGLTGAEPGEGVLLLHARSSAASRTAQRREAEAAHPQPARRSRSTGRRCRRRLRRRGRRSARRARRR